MCPPPNRGRAERGERATLRSLFFSSRYTPEVFLPLKLPLRQLLFSALPLPPPGSGLSVNKVDPHLRRVILKNKFILGVDWDWLENQLLYKPHLSTGLSTIF